MRIYISIFINIYIILWHFTLQYLTIHVKFNLKLKPILLHFFEDVCSLTLFTFSARHLVHFTLRPSSREQFKENTIQAFKIKTDRILMCIFIFPFPKLLSKKNSLQLFYSYTNSDIATWEHYVVKNGHFKRWFLRICDLWQKK